MAGDVPQNGTNQMQTSKLRPTLTTTIAPELMAATKAIQAEERRTLSGVVEDLLRAGLAARSRRLAGVRRSHGRNSTGAVRA
jgi:hypothetical protein